MNSVKALHAEPTKPERLRAMSVEYDMRCTLVSWPLFIDGGSSTQVWLSDLG